VRTAGQVIIHDNFFSKETLEDLVEGRYIVASVKDESTPCTTRRKLNIHHDKMVAEMGTFMNSDKLCDAIRDWQDLSWRAVYNGAIKAQESALSIYQPGDGFDWHVDHCEFPRILSWLVALNEPRGGELEWTTDPFPGGPNAHKEFQPGWIERQPPTLNTLVLMPTYYPHRALPTYGERYVLHGHFRI